MHYTTGFNNTTSTQGNVNREVRILHFRYFMATVIAILFIIFADISISTRNFYTSFRDKQWPIRKRQTGAMQNFLFTISGSFKCIFARHYFLNIYMVILNNESYRALCSAFPHQITLDSQVANATWITAGTGTCISPVPVNHVQNILTSLLLLAYVFG